MGAFDDLIPTPGDAAAPPAKAPPRAIVAKPRPSGPMHDAAGAMFRLTSAIPFADELGAAAEVPARMFAGQAKSPGEAWTQARAYQQQTADEFQAFHPIAGNLAHGTGFAAGMFVPGGRVAEAAVAAPKIANVAKGAAGAAGTAGLYGLADKGSLQERVSEAFHAAANPVVLALGGTAGVLAPSAAKVAAQKAPSSAKTLGDIGVSTSIPQKMGGWAKGLEDLAMRFPIVGQAVSGSRNRQLEQLNRGVALKALFPIGEKLPKSVKPGFDMVEHVDRAIGRVYDKAAALAPKIAVDQAFLDEMADIATRKVDLADSVAKQFDNIVLNRLSRLGQPQASGAMAKQIHSELGALQGEAAKKGEDTLASMLGETRRAVMGIVERTSPEAGALVKRADEGWGVYSIMNDAAAAASNRGGVFLPGQLITQVRAAGKRMGSNMTGKGKAPLQDIATAAAQTIPDSYGNPGTANATLLAAGGWGGFNAPMQTAVAAGGLTAAATPYMLMARKVVEELPANPTPRQAFNAQARLKALAAKDPAVAGLYNQVRGGLARQGGAAAAMQAQGASSQ